MACLIVYLVVRYPVVHTSASGRECASPQAAVARARLLTGDRFILSSPRPSFRIVLALAEHGAGSLMLAAGFVSRCNAVRRVLPGTASRKSEAL